MWRLNYRTAQKEGFHQNTWVLSLISLRGVINIYGFLCSVHTLRTIWQHSYVCALWTPFIINTPRSIHPHWFCHYRLTSNYTPLYIFSLSLSLNIVFCHLSLVFWFYTICCIPNHLSVCLFGSPPFLNEKQGCGETGSDRHGWMDELMERWMDWCVIVCVDG